MKDKFKRAFDFLKQTAKEWNRSDPFRKGAVLAFYAILSLPSLLMIIVWSLGRIYGEKSIQGSLETDIETIVGPEVADYVGTLINNAYLDGAAPWYMNTIGIGILVFSATTLFFQFQFILNSLWNVVADSRKGIWNVAINRLTSLGLIFFIVALMLVSMISSSLIAAFSSRIQEMLGVNWRAGFSIANIILSLVILTVLFAMMYKYFPDVKLPWPTVIPGAVFTAVLFNLGNFLLSIYFEHFDPSSNYGIAGVVVLLMVWINYTSLILLFGASFTKVLALRSRYDIRPKSYARWDNDYIHFHERNIYLRHYSEVNEVPSGKVRRHIMSGRYKDPNQPENSIAIWERFKMQNPDVV